MRRAILFPIVLILLGAGNAVSKPHQVIFGKWLPVKLFIGPNEERTIDVKIRPLYVDGRLREFTTGEPHDVTDSLFVIRRAYRLSDWLPEDEGKPHRWKWQRGGWLMVDRSSGRITALKLPDFDSFYSAASWYRDYAAYCGVSDDGEKLYALVVQLGRKKPLLRQALGSAGGGDMPDSECPSPAWQRQPVRVTFAPRSGQKLTFNVRGHAADLQPSPQPADEEQPFRP